MFLLFVSVKNKVTQQMNDHLLNIKTRHFFLKQNDSLTKMEKRKKEKMSIHCQKRLSLGSIEKKKENECAVKTLRNLRHRKVPKISALEWQGIITNEKKGNQIDTDNVLTRSVLIPTSTAYSCFLRVLIYLESRVEFVACYGNSFIIFNDISSKGIQIPVSTVKVCNKLLVIVLLFNANLKITKGIKKIYSDLDST